VFRGQWAVVRLNLGFRDEQRLVVIRNDEGKGLMFKSLLKEIRTKGGEYKLDGGSWKSHAIKLSEDRLFGTIVGVVKAEKRSVEDESSKRTQ